MELTFKKLQKQDLPFLQSLFTDKQITKYLPELLVDLESLEKWYTLLNETDNEYIICIDGQYIGECNLTVHDNNEGEIGFVIVPECWRMGYGTKTVEFLLTKAEEHNMQSVEAVCDKRNAVAQHILEKNGFRKFGDGALFQILNENTTDIEKQYELQILKKNLKISRRILVT